MSQTIKDVEVSSRDRSMRIDAALRIFDITADSSYPTGGYACPATLFGLTSVLFVLSELSGDGAKPVYNHSTNKMMWFLSGVSGGRLGEAPNTTNLSTSTARVLVFGR